jgi:hypothetical protein
MGPGCFRASIVCAQDQDEWEQGGRDHHVLHIQHTVPMDYQILPDKTSRASLTRQVETLLPYPVKVDAGDCVVVFYGRKGDGASDNETQVHAVLTR